MCYKFKKYKYKNGIGEYATDRGHITNVVVDLVSPKDPLVSKPQQGVNDDDLDNESESYIKLGTVTGHVRSPNRLNVALTRAMHGLVVVCQAALLVGNPRNTKSWGKAYNAIGNMVDNARWRKCLISDTTTEDTYPESIALREALEERIVREKRRIQDAEDLGFIAEHKKAAMELKAKKSAPKPVTVPKYRTAKGHTTRPIMASRAVVEAERHDREVEEQERLVKERSLASAKEEEQAALDKALSESRMDVEFPPLKPGTKVDFEPMQMSENAPGQGD